MTKESLKHENARFRILAEVSQQITSILDIDDLLARVARLVQKTFNYYHVGIGLIEKGDVVYRIGAGVLWDDPKFQFKPTRLKVGVEGITGWVAHTSQPALVPDVTKDPHYVWMQGSETCSELIVPITVKGRTIGVLDVQSRKVNDFDESDLELMQSLANQTGIAIENARLFSETQRLLIDTEARADRLAIINHVQQGLTSKLDVQSIYELVGDKFSDIFDAQVVMISAYDPETNLVEHRYAVERGLRIPWPGTHPSGGFRSQIIQTRKPILLNSNVAEESARLGQPVKEGTDMPKSWLGVPIFDGDQVTGIMSVQNLERENAFDESDVQLLQMFAASMSIALENARLFSNIQRRAEQFRVLSEVSQHTISLTTVEELLKNIAQLVKESFNYLHVGIGFVEQDYVVSKVEIGAFEETYRGIHIPMGHGIWGKVAQSGQSLLSTHVEDIDDHGHMVVAGIRCHVCVPLKVKDKVIGVISAASDQINGLDKSDETILQTVANQASVAIENVRLHEQAKLIAVLEERQRLGRELHDSVTQSLYGINLFAEAASGQLAAGRLDPARGYLGDIQKTAQESLAEMRLLIYELRPPILERDGLVAALQNRLYSVENRAGIKFTLQSNMGERLPISMEEGLYRISHEALNNTLKHAHAKNIQVSLLQDGGRLTMEISDDGIGFDPTNDHQEGCLGLVSMRERALAQGWQFVIDSSPGAGTRVRVEVKR
jgi:signal transduction histidine kinase/uncharacterized protein YigA (DUF484 family)